jgi:hypothetical protein
MKTKPIVTMSIVSTSSHGPARNAMELPTMKPTNPSTTSAAPVTPVILRMGMRMPAEHRRGGTLTEARPRLADDGWHRLLPRLSHAHLLHEESVKDQPE